eukprot:4910081-Amphidinium_carterae.1
MAAESSPSEERRVVDGDDPPSEERRVVDGHGPPRPEEHRGDEGAVGEESGEGRSSTMHAQGNDAQHSGRDSHSDWQWGGRYANAWQGGRWSDYASSNRSNHASSWQGSWSNRSDERWQQGWPDRVYVTNGGGAGTPATQTVQEVVVRRDTEPPPSFDGTPE